MRRYFNSSVSEENVQGAFVIFPEKTGSEPGIFWQESLLTAGADAIQYRSQI